MSSSSASQWIPRGLSSQASRCAGVAASRRRNHARGDAEGAAVIQFDPQVVFIAGHGLRRHVHSRPFPGVHDGLWPCGRSDALGKQPEFGLCPVVADMDVRRLARATLVRVEEKFEAIQTQGNRHDVLRKQRAGGPGTDQRTWLLPMLCGRLTHGNFWFIASRAGISSPAGAAPHVGLRRVLGICSFIRLRATRA